MVSIAGFGASIESFITSAIQIVSDYTKTLFLEAYKAIKGPTQWIVSTFPFDDERKLLVLSILLFGSFVLFIGLIGGQGVHGSQLSEEGPLGLSGKTVRLGSNAVVGNIDEGLKGFGEQVTTTIGENVSTTTTIPTLQCSNNNQCEWSGSFDSFCCPPDTGGCAGFCASDCIVECEVICSGTDCWCDPNTLDYSQCKTDCMNGGCITSFGIPFLVYPDNDSTISTTNLKLDWVAA